jgi:hypothetical protein
MAFEIRSSFIGSYKLGDNINYNLKLLALLYRYFANSSEDDRKLLRKPIIVILVSITEAVLYDLHMRIKILLTRG